MTRSEARTAIRDETDHEAASDTQVTNTQLNTEIDVQHKLWRRRISNVAPSLYLATSATQTLTTSDVAFDVPSDFERLFRMERQYGDQWYPVDISDELNRHLDALNVAEEAEDFTVSPTELAPGTYRMVYVMAPATLSADSGSGGVLLVPAGLEKCITSSVSAWVYRKLDEDGKAAACDAIAETIFAQQRPVLAKRYGRHGVPGLRQVRHW